MKLVLKILALPVLFVVKVICILGIATIAAVFLLVWAVMKVENIGESLGAFIRS